MAAPTTRVSDLRGWGLIGDPRLRRPEQTHLRAEAVEAPARPACEDHVPHLPRRHRKCREPVACEGARHRYQHRSAGPSHVLMAESGPCQVVHAGRPDTRPGRTHLALDAQAEYELFARLRSLADGRTAVFIS